MKKYIVRFREDSQAKDWEFDNSKGLVIEAKSRSAAIAKMASSLIEYWDFSFIDAVKKFKAKVIKDDII